MLVAKVNRDAIGAVLDGVVPPNASPRHRSDFSDSSVRPGDILALWADDHVEWAGLPRVLVADAKTQRDLLAWVSSYYGQLRPLTAYVRLTEPDVAHAMLAVKRKRFDSQILSAWAGLLLASVSREAHEQAAEVIDRVTSTFEFALLRALYVGALTAGRESLEDAWRTLSKSDEQLGRPRRRVHDTIIRLSKSVASSPQSTSVLFDVGPSDPVIEACQQLMINGSVDDSLLNRLAEGFPATREAIVQMTGVREDRVRAFEAVASELSSTIAMTPPRSEMAAFLFGFVGSLIAPGTLDHLFLFDSSPRPLMTSRMWYGLCAGLYRGSKVLNHGGGLGRRVLRDLLSDEDLFDSPRCDLAFSEYSMLTTSAAGTDVVFRFRRGKQLAVDLLPTVTTTINLEPKQVSQTEPISAVRKVNEVAAIAQELRAALERVHYVERRLERFISLEIDTGDPTRHPKRAKR